MDGSDSQSVLLKREPAEIAVLTLNRPAVRNALDTALVTALRTTLADLAEDPSLRVLVLTGADGRAFCAGADLSERQRMTPEERTAHTEHIAGAAETISDFPVPVIAAVNGYALAGGAELAIACDLRVASTNAIFGFPEVKIGIFPGAGGVLRLPRIVGGSAARDLLFTGRRVNAAEALRFGLIDRLVDGSDARLPAIALATEIAANAPLAIRALKRAMVETLGLPEARAAPVIARYRRSLDGTADYAEGLAAFQEGRVPRFSGQ